MIKQNSQLSDWRNINPELLICADEQGDYSKIGGKGTLDLFTVLDLQNIQQSENKKELRR